VSTPNDGGPAFPVVVSEGDAVVSPGMSLRDWFAGQALTPFASVLSPQGAAQLAYEYADAMLAARQGGPKP
jgi:hypothetical protein